MRIRTLLLNTPLIVELVVGSALRGQNAGGAAPGSSSSGFPIGSTPAKNQLSTGLEDRRARQQRVTDMNYPPDFARRTSHRFTFDQFAQRHHTVAGEGSSFARPPTPRRKNNDRFLNFVSPQTPESILNYRSAQERRVLPLRGFRAPILDEAQIFPPVTLPAQGLTKEQLKAADIISRRLAHDGLVATLVDVVSILGPEKFVSTPSAAAQDLLRLGFPVDLLRCFQPGEGRVGSDADLPSRVARRLSEGKSIETVKAELKTLRFQFQRSGPGFLVAPENGEEEIGLVRMQVEGGFRNGIVPGESLDITAQMVAALPDADFVVTIRNDFATNLHWLAQHCWPLKRTNQLTIIAEKLDVSPWPQDNGKPGVTTLKGSGATVLATLVPRYASQGEDASLFMPGDSYSMDGLRGAGHGIIQSPLLFQGGNLLAVHDPAAQKRVLLISEAEVYRNTALGLTREQVLESFREEFGVDVCVVLPVVSHHLDFDFTVRTHRGQVLAFVNDPQAAVRLMVERGLGALEAVRGMTPAAAQAARANLREGKNLLVVKSVNDALQRYLNPQSQYPLSLAGAFVVGKADSSIGNFQCFLAALDLLRGATTAEDKMPADELSRNYLIALRDLEQSRQAQIRELQKLGWKVVPIPSLPDMYRTINYVNGLHDRTRYLMPAQGGFYAFLDEAAGNAFKQALGPEIAIIPIFSAASQRNHGAVHCMASAYPRVAGARF